KPSLRLPMDWLVTRKSSSAKTGYMQAVTTLKSAEARLPQPISAFLAKQQLIVTEIVNNEVLGPWADLPPESTSDPLPRLNSKSQKDLILDLLVHIGLQPVKESEVQIFDSRRDGFNLSITADIQVQNGGQSVIFTSKKLPDQFVKVLKEKKTDVIVLQGNSPPTATIETLLTALHLSYTNVPYMFPVSSNPALAGVTVVFPTIRFVSKKNSPVYLINFDMDADLYTYLHNKMKFDILAF
ncbi:MAG: hypothetical protein PHN75_10275, partial [Syntrophales bacterium]|nr:hypothetical protein [Syntrophales bacterium]